MRGPDDRIGSARCNVSRVSDESEKTMGKSQEEDMARPVKRQVVSASANLEVVSEENFARRLQGMSACLNCQKERSVGAGGGGGGGGSGGSAHGPRPSHKLGGRGGKQGRRKQAKSNTPIVIHLKDTLRSVLQQRQRSFDTDSDVSARSTDDDVTQEVFGDVSSIPEFVPQQAPRVPPSRSHPHHQLSLSRQRREKSKKNLTALISVIEKAHRKDPSSSGLVESNLSQNSICSKLSHLLNNAVSLHDIGLGSQPHPPQRNIGECDNVDVICNDLYETEKKSTAETLEDSDSVLSDKSSITSSSDALSDSDSLVVEESAGVEFTPEELQRLAEYTTGFPLYRYDCAPSECPECLSAWYTHQIYQYEGCYLDTLVAPRATRPDSTSSKHRSKKHSSNNNNNERDAGGVLAEGADSEGCVFAPATADDATSEDRSSEVERGSTNITNTTTTTTCLSLASSSSSLFSSSGKESGWPYSKGARQLWDIDVSQAGRRNSREQRGDNPFADSVYLDLTGTDVSISVYYHHSLMQDEVARATMATSAAMLSPAFCAAAAAAAAAASSSLYSAYYSTFAGSAIYSLPMPLTLFSEAALPKIAMVPPHELKKCEYIWPTRLSTPSTRPLPITPPTPASHPSVRIVFRG